MFRRRRPDPIDPVDPVDQVDPARLDRRWRPHVEAALAARSRYAEVVSHVEPGPTRDRLAELGSRVDEAVLGAWEAALRAQAMAATVAALDPDRLTAELKEARRRLSDASGRADEAEAAMVESLAAQHATAHRLWNELDEADGRLRLVEVRLGALVARAAELGFRQGPTAGLDAAGDDLQRLVGELGHVRTALDELDAR